MEHGELDWFMEEHDALDERLPALAEALCEDGIDLAKVRSDLAGLALELEQHLEHEERLLYPWIARLLPDAEAALEQLALEHVQLLSLVATLQFAVADARLAEDRHVHGARFVRLLREHAKGERRLVARATATDSALRRAAAAAPDRPR
jgi:Hemerythrin HHE cation binding domain